MSLNSNFPRNNLQSPFAPRQNLAIFHRRAFQVCEYRVWRRRRLKTNRTTVVVRSHLGPLPFFENLFQNLLSQFPSVNSLDLIAPSLGFASGAAIYLSRFNSNSNSSPVSEIGEWILFASPTPFNRFVMLRCPSISFEGGQLLDDVNDKLVKEDRHFVKVNSGKIQIWAGDDEVLNEKLVYQRVCVSTDDGGVISLDWPENLDLMEERGLDTTLLLIPGTAEGSMDNSIRSFVCESLKRGCFPVVMNPRGCGGSPLTTPRLFTAADSDDICTAVQFINRARPWTTLMGVGWGYGANMLTKYLAEVGEKTPLIAATCINNPFDLEEATRSSPYHIALDRKLTGGLVDILRSNKELFRGKAKVFDVEKALLANSIRDFEKSISMISYGFEAIEDFYASSSTRNVIGNVKIPVLFIQSDDAVVPLFSIPRSLIAENPFTSLLLCSCLPSSVIARGICALSWCQHLTIQWLAAVELGLLKGRHPLLKDIDVSINPSEGLALLDARASDKSGRVNTLSQSNVVNGYTGYPLKGKLEESDTPAGIGARFRQDPPRNPEIEDKVLQQESNGTLDQTSPGDAEFANEEVNPFDVETGQVLQTAEVVMNMLDVSMPGTLTEEQKKKVLTAVGQGKTVINALQDAVPQDVREKLTTAVSGILPTQGTNVKLEGLLNVGPIVASGLSSKIQEKVGGLSSGGGYEDPHSLGVDDLADSCNDTQVTSDKTAVRLEPELQSSNTLQDPMDTGQVQPNDIQSTQNTDTSREGTAKYSDYNENGSDTGAQPDFSSQPERASGTEDSASDHNKTDQSCPASSAEAQPTERVGSDDLKSDESSMNSVLKQDSPDSPTFSVSQALGALTDIDDSTQVAVNSVFGVIEDMISQLEDNTDVDHKNEVRDQGTGFTTQNPQSKEYNGSERTENRKNDLSLQSGMFDIISTNGGRDSLNDSRTRWVEKEKHIESSDSFKGNSGENDMVSLVNKAGRGTSEYLASNKLFAEHSNKVRDIRIVPFITTTNKYSAPLYQENLRKYLLSKIQNTESLDLDRTTALFLEYIPEEGQWKPLEQPGNIEYSDIATQEGVKEVTQAHSPSKADRDEVIEPSYVIMDVEEQQEPVREYDRVDNPNEKVAISNDTVESFVKTVILDSLKVEVDRRLSAESMKDMEPNLSRDMEHFANAVSLAAGHSKTQTRFLDGEDCNLEKLGTLNGEHLARAMSFAILETDYLRSVLPYGVVMGSCLAALRKFFDVAALNGTDQTEAVALDQVNHSVERNRVRPVETEADRVLLNKLDCECNASKSTDGKKTGLQKLSNETVMVGAVTAALGASAVLVHQRDSDKGKSTSETLVNSSEERENHHEKHDNLEEEISEKSQNNIVTSLAEKAMSVAGPVVPMKEGGEVDQDRLVALLAELGQKGGMLKMVGKLALLWGGIRGAMSLTDRLILFLRVAERPLFQRILSFVGMVLVLWSPVVVPLLPTLVQSWATHSSSKFAELICIIGLYSSITMLVMLWGRRIRGYENPFEQYGLDFTSPSKIQNFLKGLVGGVVVVLSVHSLNSLLGCVRLSWPSTCISNYSDFLTWLKVYGKMLLRVAQGLVTATGVALVEELIFRSWLPDEIATDLGYYRGIIISGLAFSLAQRSPWAIPGLWLLSLGLAGARQRSGGSLSIPIGLRAGIMASNFVLQTGGFLTYQPNFPRWVTGTHPLHLFSGISGLACSLLLAIVLRPMEPLHQKESTRTIRG